MPSNKQPLEPELKSIIINNLISKELLCPNSLIINEFTVGDFTRRVDLALIKSNRMFAVEVKSNADSLIRLQGQVSKYLDYFDKVIVATAPKHTSKALEVTPPNVAVWEIRGDKVIIKRKGRIKEINSKKELLEMMTIIELKKLNKKLNCSAPDQKRKSLELSLLKAPVSKLREGVFDFIQARYKSRNDKFFEKIDERLSTPDDLTYLSISRKNITRPETTNNIESFIHAIEQLQKSYSSSTNPK